MLEVDLDKLDEKRLRPDEDFIAQVLHHQERRNKSARSLEAGTKAVRDRIDDFKGNWKLSLEHMGTCAYKGTIPPQAIRRLALVSERFNPRTTLMFSDPSVTVLNFKVVGSEYRGITEWLFAREFTAEEFILNCSSFAVTGTESSPERIAATEQVLADRQRLEICRVVNGQLFSPTTVAQAAEKYWDSTHHAIMKIHLPSRRPEEHGRTSCAPPPRRARAPVCHQKRQSAVKRPENPLDGPAAPPRQDPTPVRVGGLSSVQLR